MSDTAKRRDQLKQAQSFAMHGINFVTVPVFDDTEEFEALKMSDRNSGKKLKEMAGG
ncbi:DUF1382 family protein [Kushneria sp. Sum13]|uniref:DUF1382 family protein n=1 Tax=Kushneria sp. Sum13 TaxID=3459196 RepID=UPI004045797B